MDFFNFEWYVRVYNEFIPDRDNLKPDGIQDITYGKENFAISCVNSLDKNYPEYVEYSRVRIPQSSVQINTGKFIMQLIIQGLFYHIKFNHQHYTYHGIST